MVYFQCIESQHLPTFWSGEKRFRPGAKFVKILIIRSFYFSVFSRRDNSHHPLRWNLLNMASLSKGVPLLPSIKQPACVQFALVPFVIMTLTGIPCGSTTRCILVLSSPLHRLHEGVPPQCWNSVPFLWRLSFFNDRFSCRNTVVLDSIP